MPTYTYKCMKCVETFEERRSISCYRDELKCPHCGHEGVGDDKTSFTLLILEPPKLDTFQINASLYGNDPGSKMLKRIVEYTDADGKKHVKDFTHAGNYSHKGQRENEARRKAAKKRK